nr:DUF6221 family protein [Streptomyces sp. SID8499]
MLEWLCAQLDEDERIARATEWCVGTHTFNGWDVGRADEYEWEIQSRNAVIGRGLNEEFARHIVAHDPARVLREIDAKRRITELCEPPLVEVTSPGDSERSFIPGEGPPWGLNVLKLLALPYADRPGYREEWRP